MGILILLGVIGLIVWAVARDNTRSRTTELNNQLSRRNQDWVDFIASYRQVVRSPKESALIQRMLNDVVAQGLGQSPAQKIPILPPTKDQQTASIATAASALPSQEALPPAVSGQPPRKSINTQLDNASLLLYFGAFLFVASAGLFVAFGGAVGIVRLLVVLLVSIALYTTGVWLYRTRPKLRQAGQAFAGIGVVLAPLVGSALYVYVLHHRYGALVWLLTSLFCLAMYTHALLVFRTVLMGYVLIFTLLSLFESGIGLAHVPLYYYGWGLAAVGLLLRSLRYFQRQPSELGQAANGGATLFLPLAIIVALAMTPSQGTVQLGISLLISAIYYGLEVLRTRGNEREIDAVVSQLAATIGVIAVTYGATKNTTAADYSFLVINTLQLVAMTLFGTRGRLWQNFGSVLLVLVCGVAAVSVPHHALLLVAVLASLCTAAAIWLHQRRMDAYAVAALSLVAIPYIAGQLVRGPLSPAWQTTAGLGSVILLLASYISQPATWRKLPGWLPATAGTYLVGVAAVLVCSFFASPIVTLVSVLVLGVTLLVLLQRDHNGDWADVAGVTLVVPLLHAWQSDAPGVFLASTTIALVALILLALRFRREALRWLSTITWLLLPTALGYDHIGGHWSTAVYAWVYVIAMIGLVVSRAVARGVIYLSSSVPMSSYARNASLSYVFGYTAAALLALCISLTAHGSRLHTTLILGVLGLMTIVLARTVEKRSDIFAFLPVIAQAAILSAVRPAESLAASYVFVLLSSAAAMASYLLLEESQHRSSHLGDIHATLQVSVATAFVAPASALFAAKPNWLMALSLLFASLVLQYHIRHGKQQDRELAGGIIVLAIWWLLVFLHIHELQAYTQTAVLLLSFYAYLRAVRGERKESDTYLWWAVGVATIPLIFEVLSTARADYGWWLLLEQVTIMLVGMAVQRRFVVRWGLYVAVAAVLFQLRSYGYAALGLLAVFLISLAIYQLEKYNEKK
ncbi:MAG TPA: hypothetical protein VMB52_03040 [Verrucomicrobiae bacterium]|nr:hypothetical protein [Verrucomicrobiae bacterium]